MLEGRSLFYVLGMATDNSNDIYIYNDDYDFVDWYNVKEEKCIKINP